MWSYVFNNREDYCKYFTQKTPALTSPADAMHFTGFDFAVEVQNEGFNVFLYGTKDGWFKFGMSYTYAPPEVFDTNTTSSSFLSPSFNLWSLGLTLKEISNLTGDIDHRLTPSIEKVFGDFLDVVPNARIKPETALILPYFENASSGTKDPYSPSYLSKFVDDIAVTVNVIN
ncbi:OLC1v1036892C1 [Oldenlandia corymbosa var. corymbosa]|uniref:OLC1v1036892C1 n=1 Tax=Oldenlandia corymbosa var. corymbosa TaxID=529605 RepID=A0AAV1CZL9_OLDCO|nr:OLC1v1036892C1 [Oldenlandia corymbosa var. corymbosa]